MKLERQLGRVLSAFFLLSLGPPLAAQQTVRNAPTALSKPYQKCLNEDVRYILTDEERVDFKRLTTDRQRDDFIVKFWERRNPILGSPKNECKEEHYRGLAYANSHFAAGIPGRRTDCGRIYIIWGPPDEIDRHFSAAGSENLARDEKGQAIPYDLELWHYRDIEGIGKDVTVKFVDTCSCGEYRIPVYKDDLRKYSPK